MGHSSRETNGQDFATADEIRRLGRRVIGAAVKSYDRTVPVTWEVDEPAGGQAPYTTA